MPASLPLVQNVTEAERRADCLYYETLSLAELVGQPGNDPGELLGDCANALANLRYSLEQHYAKPEDKKLH